ncbi:alpha/beta fold hydrolase [Robertkochia sediminum]|uniref:alpha/beta fold hydrolase n=1 Tax=Robertkochia sediminum TaxID=2785326 RepID=UPI00193288B2|nr:alpha/beta hydrolase [Robertkochia sediminum]MBL7473712.1 alpha/beta hydrolase [Robertkochia sediminum]
MKYFILFIMLMPVHFISSQTIASGAYAPESSDVSMFYRESGEGDKVVLMIHGLGSNSGGFKKMEELISEQHKTVVIDLPGYGNSEQGSFDPGMENYAALIIEFVRQRGYKDVVLAGHSMGGQIAMTIAMDPRSQAWLHGLFLIAPAGIETFTAEEKSWFMQYMTPEMMSMLPDEQIRKNFDINFAAGKLPEDAMFMLKERMAIKSDPDAYRTYLETVSRNVEAMLSEPVADKFESIEVPVWVVYGKQDYLIPNKILHPDMTLEDLKAKCNFPHDESRFMTVDNGGHFLTWDQPEKLALLLMEFASL